MNRDEEFMRRALVLAGKGWGNTSPNPMVGAVLVKNGKIIGEGYHKYAGADHAEVMAIKDVLGETPSGKLRSKTRLAGSTLYVNLEPCCHYGRTPPCTGAIIESKIKRVVVGGKDPDPRVSGKGLAELRKAGIIVKTGVLEKEAQRLNEGYLYYKRTGLPFVIMKMAQTLDGKIATMSGESKWITGEESREYVQEVRAGVDAILVGSGTVIKDNPELVVHPIRDCVSNGARVGKKYRRYPARVILDTRARVPIKYFKTSPPSPLLGKERGGPVPKTYWIIGRASGNPLRSIPDAENVEIVRIDTVNGHINIKSLLKELGERGIQSILVEGGAQVHGAFFDAKVVNKVLCFIAPKLMGGAESLASIGGKGINKIEQMPQLKDVSVSFLGQDLVIEGYL